MKLLESVYENFKGMNRRSDRLNTSPDYLYDLLNGYIRKDLSTEKGVVTQRSGSSKLNSVALGSDYGSTKIIRNVFEAKWYGGGADTIIRAGTAWGKFDGVNTFNAFDTGRGNDVIGQCVMFQNQFLYVDGGIPRKMTSAYAVSNLSADANMPQDATAIWVHRDKVWLNSAANPMTAYFCTTNSANGAASWSGTTDAGTLDLSTVLPEGDTIRTYRTMGANSNLLVIICDKYVVVYSAGSNVYNFTLLKYFKNTCISVNAIDYILNDIVFPSRNMLTTFGSAENVNDTNINSVSALIDPLYRQMVSQLTDTTTITGVFDRTLNHYYLTFTATNNYQTLVYSVDIGNFVARWTYPFQIYSWCAKTNGTLYAGSDSYVYIMNNGTNDDGIAISWKMAMPALYMNRPQNYKKPAEFEALLQNSISMTLYLDYWYGLSVLTSDKITKSISVTTTSSLWDVALWDSSYWDTQGNTIYNTGDIYGRGRLMFIELRHSTLNATITIPWFIIRYALEGIR